MVGVQPEIRTGAGHLVTTEPATRVKKADLLMVPARAARHPAEVFDYVIGDQSLPARTLIASTRARGTAIASACAGTALLAEAGILDGLHATTSWWLSPAFRSRYPTVHLDEGRMVVASDGITTAGAAFGHVDLALAVVRASSPAVADLVTRYLVIDERPSQSAYAIPSALAQSDPTVAEFERWARQRLAEPISIPQAAKAIGVSERMLQRFSSGVAEGARILVPTRPRLLSAGRRHSGRAQAIASNEPFSSWTKTFTDPRLCAAIVDRLTFAGQIIETGTTSYRLAHARPRRAAG